MNRILTIKQLKSDVRKEAQDTKLSKANKLKLELLLCAWLGINLR